MNIRNEKASDDFGDKFNEINNRLTTLESIVQKLYEKNKIYESTHANHETIMVTCIDGKKFFFKDDLPKIVYNLFVEDFGCCEYEYTLKIVYDLFVENSDCYEYEYTLNTIENTIFLMKYNKFNNEFHNYELVYSFLYSHLMGQSNALTLIYQAHNGFKTYIMVLDDEIVRFNNNNFDIKDIIQVGEYWLCNKNISDVEYFCDDILSDRKWHCKLKTYKCIVYLW
jgi:hypothetical protein